MIRYVKYFFLTLLLCLNFEMYSNDEITFYSFTLEGNVCNINGEPYKNFPVNIYADTRDTLLKYTVYTDTNGYYHFTKRYAEACFVEIRLKGYCDNEWVKYSDTVTAYDGVYTKDFFICHTKEEFERAYVIKGYVLDTVADLPVVAHPVVITNSYRFFETHTVKTDENGFFSDTVIVSILDSIDLNVTTYSFSEEVKTVSQAIKKEYSPEEEIITFYICSTDLSDWTLAFYTNVFDNAQTAYFCYLSNMVADSVFWNFGDGFAGKGHEIFHYFQPGQYNICMTGYINGVAKSYNKRIIIGETVNCSGKVLASGVEIRNGYIFAVPVNKTGASFHDKARIKNGNFSFERMARGEYYLYAVPDLGIDTLHFPKYIGTYIGGSCQWESSTFFVLEKDMKNVEIELVKNEKVYFGQNNIKISLENDLFKKFKIVNVVLYDDSGTPLNSMVLDSEQPKSFRYLPDGEYTVKTEIPGIETQEFSFFLDADYQPHISFFVNNDKITYQIMNIEKIILSEMQIYPNPFDRYFVVKTDRYPVEVILYDENGNMAFSENVKSEIVPVPDLPTGKYFAVVKENNTVIHKKTLIKN